MSSPAVITTKLIGRLSDCNIYTVAVHGTLYGSIEVSKKGVFLKDHRGEVVRKMGTMEMIRQHLARQFRAERYENT